MRILIDECVDPRVKRLLRDKPSATVHEQGWALWRTDLCWNGRKRSLMYVTIDGSLEYQQNLAKYRIGVVVVHVPKNQLPCYSAVQQELLAALRAVRAGGAIHVGARAGSP